jgi:hypothetical protein
MTSLGALRNAMRNIAAKKGAFTLFGLFMRADALGTWDLVVAAPWLEGGTLKAISDFVALLKGSAGKQVFRGLSRVQIFGDDDPALEDFLTAVSVDDGEFRIKKSNLFGLDIDEAIVLRAKRPESDSVRETAPVATATARRR